MPSSSTAQQTSRHFATSSRVHPSYLPYLQAPKPPKVAKWIPPAVAIAGIGGFFFPLPSDFLLANVEPLSVKTNKLTRTKATESPSSSSHDPSAPPRKRQTRQTASAATTSWPTRTATGGASRPSRRPVVSTSPSSRGDDGLCFLIAILFLVLVTSLSLIVI